MYITVALVSILTVVTEVRKFYCSLRVWSFVNFQC